MRPIKFSSFLGVGIILFMSISEAHAQSSLESHGYFKGGGKVTEALKVLGESNGNFVVLEKEAQITLSVGGTRDLTIKLLNKKSLKPSNEIQLKDIGVGWRLLAEKRTFLNGWLSDDRIRILTYSKRDEVIELTEIDAKTLKVSTKRRVIYNIKDDDNVSVDNGLVHNVFESCTSPSGEWVYLDFFVSGNDKKAAVASILLTKSGEVEHVKVISLDTKYGFDQRHLSVTVNDNGEAIWLFHLRESKIANYGSLESGQTILKLRRDGTEAGRKHLTISGGADLGVGPLKIRSYKNWLWIAGYDYNFEGTISGVFDMSANIIEGTIAFTKFDPEVGAQFKTYKEKDYPKMFELAEKKNKSFVPKHFACDDISISENGELVLVSSYTKVREGTSTTDAKKPTQYYFKEVLLTKFSPNNEVLFSKVIHMSEYTIQPHLLPAYNHRAHFVNGNIVLFINDNYDNINGYQLQGSKGSGRGAAVIISSKGTWSKIPFDFTGSTANHYVHPELAYEFTSGSFIIPTTPKDGIYIGYVTIKFN